MTSANETRLDRTPSTGAPRTQVLVICTGNAARSVMAGSFLRTHADHLSVVTAGTLTVNGQPISWRTRTALDRVGLAAPGHTSQQIERHHVESADMIMALAPEHVEWIRREHPDAAWKTATLKRLERDLAPTGDLGERIRSLELHTVQLEPWEEVVDPGGGEVEDFIACAFEVVDLLGRLIDRLDPLELQGR